MRKTIFTLLLSLFFLSLATKNFAQLEERSMNVSSINKMGYLIYSPKIKNNEQAPLVVFLHGGGESGNDLEKVKKHGLPKLISEGKEYNFYMFAPQNPYVNGFWDDRIVDQMVDSLVNKLNIDTNRIYLIGMSRGGYGVWRVALNNPDKYAAMISICAASIPISYTERLITFPVWFFHGEKDQVIPVEQTIAAYNKMKEFNPNVKITLYPETGHDAWTTVFENEDALNWLLMQRN